MNTRIFRKSPSYSFKIVNHRRDDRSSNPPRKYRSLLQYGLILLVLSFTLAGCELIKRTAIPALPCGPDDLVAPVGAFPPLHAIVTELRPTFTWDFPTSCIPEGFQVDVTTYGGYGYGTTYSGITGDPSTHWDITDTLEPATSYEWRVAAMAGGTLGPYSTSTRFFTGPVCETADLMAPTLIAPLDGSTVDNPFPPLNWDYPEDCLPESFLTELDLDATFPGPNLVEEASYPAIGVIPREALIDCTEYYWRVTARNSDGMGPISEVWSFLTDFGGVCVAPAPEAKARMNATCRDGPDKLYEPAGYLLEGETAPIEGRNQEGTWWWIVNPDWEGHCWIWNDLVEVTGQVADLQFIEPLPLPTPTSTPTFTPEPPEQGCYVYNQNQVLICVVPCPPNAQPGGACTP